MYKVGSLLAIKHAFCNRVDDTDSGNYKLQYQVVYEYEAPISPSSVGVYASGTVTVRQVGPVTLGFEQSGIWQVGAIIQSREE